MKSILLFSCFMSFATLNNAQSAYQQAPGTPKSQDAPLSAVEVKMLKLYYQQLLNDKETLLQQETRGRTRAEGFVTKLNNDKDAQATIIYQLRDSLSILKRQSASQSAKAEPEQSITESNYRPVTVTTTDKNGIRRSATSTSGGGYIYSEIGGQHKTTKNSQYHTGPKGGCFYYSSSGNKVYVSHSFCD